MTLPRLAHHGWLAGLLGALALAPALWLGIAAPAHAVQFKALASAPLGATFSGSGDGPVDVKIADVNNDGDQDMLAVTKESGVWVYPGGSGATFSTPASASPVQSAPFVPAALCTGQLDGLRGADFVVPITGGDVRIGLQTSGTAFSSVPVSSGLTGLTSCALGDLGGDGDLDAVVGGTNGVRVLTNNGAGAFSAGATLTTVGTPTAVAIGNVNGTGGNDVVAQVGSGVAIFAEGAGAATTLTMSGTTLAGVAVANFDGVNGMDIAVGADNPGTDLIRVRLSDGLGGFGPDKGYSAPAAPSKLSTDDFTKDGIPDLLVSGASNAGLAVLPGSSSRGAFDPPALITASNVVAAASGNFDTDAAPDVATVNTTQISPSPFFSAAFYQNASGGAFSPARLSFSPVTVITGAGSDSVVTLTSLGVPNLNITGLGISGQDQLSYSVVADQCSGRSIPAGASCTITVRFLPLHVGPSPALLTVFSDASPNPTLPLDANGDTGPRPAAPANIALPTISGVAEEGKTLTCNPGTWTDPTASFDYFWARGGEGIPDASEKSYTIQYNDVNYAITCRAFASGGGGRVAAISKPVVPVDKLKPVCTIKANDQNMGTVRAQGFQVIATCSEPVTAKFRLNVSKKDKKKYHLSSTKIGTDEQKFTAPGANTLRVLIDSTPKRRLKKAKRLSITVTLTATDRVRLAAKSSSAKATAKKSS